MFLISIFGESVRTMPARTVAIPAAAGLGVLSFAAVAAVALYARPELLAPPEQVVVVAAAAVAGGAVGGAVGIPLGTWLDQKR
jgi:hypothetical protein